MAVLPSHCAQVFHPAAPHPYLQASFCLPSSGGGSDATQVTVTQLEVSRGDRTLLSDLSVTARAGDRIGLLGANGSGKSTLVQVLLAAPPADVEVTGEVTLSPRSARCFLHTQTTPRHLGGLTLVEVALELSGIGAIEQRFLAAADALATASPAAEDAYAQALEAYIAADVAEFLPRLQAVTEQLLPGRDLSGAFAELSGGQQAKFRLAIAAATPAEVLGLDEPTNDLDAAGIAWLEEFLTHSTAVIFLISHDQELLRRFTTGIIEIDKAERTAEFYAGDFASYQQESQRRAERAAADYAAYVETTEQLAAAARTRTGWAEHGYARGKRAPRDKDKHIRQRDMQRSEKSARGIAVIQRSLDRLEEVAAPRKVWNLQLTLAAAPRTADRLVSLREATVTTAHQWQLGPCDLDIGAGQRIVLRGPNGSGKSTLLDLLAGVRTPTTGRVLRGSGVQIGYLDQQRRLLATAELLSEVLHAQLPELDEAARRSLAAKFGLGGTAMAAPCLSLSPGERTRAYLAIFQARGTHLVLADEPSNHADKEAVTQFLQALDAYPGAVVVATHDRYLIEQLRMQTSWEITNGVVTVTPL